MTHIEPIPELAKVAKVRVVEKGRESVKLSRARVQMSIKLANFAEFDAAVARFVFHNATDFAPIRFLLRDEGRGQAAFLAAQVTRHPHSLSKQTSLLSSPT